MPFLDGDNAFLAFIQNFHLTSHVITAATFEWCSDVLHFSRGHEKERASIILLSIAQAPKRIKKVSVNWADSHELLVTCEQKWFKDATGPGQIK